MDLTVIYSTPGYFTMAELRAIVAQTKDTVPGEATVRLLAGDSSSERDTIEIEYKDII